jgi:hypothetical protein
MHALRSCIGAALITGAVASAVAVSPLAAQADTMHTTVKSHGSANVDPLAEAARGLPKVSPADVIKLAQHQIGITENGYGGGTKFQVWYASSPRARETVARDGGSPQDYVDAPWCDMFVSWIGHKLGIDPVMGTDAYTVAHAQWFLDNNRWGETPKPGAVVFYDFSGNKSIDDISHVGFVVKDNGDGTIKTIEGNTGGGSVEEHVRPTSDVAGYGYPLYTAP